MISWLRDFLTPRRVLAFVFIALTLGLLFCAEEDHRGAQAWTATQAKWEARGVSFDFQRLVPAPVPDDQNLATLPLFKMEPDPENQGALAPLTLRRAYTHGFDSNPDLALPSLGDWQHGRRPDIDKLHKAVAAQYGTAFPRKPLPAQSALQFAELYPFIADLRAASATRPQCRFEQDYQFEGPSRGYLSLITAQIYFSKLLTIDAVLALDAGLPDEALDDIRLNAKLLGGLRDQPILVSGLVAIGMTAINFAAVCEGLDRHAWNDAQLAQLEDILAPIDFLADYQRVMRGESIGVFIPMVEKTESSQKDIITYPMGWIELTKARAVDLNLTASTWVDAAAKLVSPRAADAYQAEIDRQFTSLAIYLPWNWLFRLTANTAQTHALSKFAEMQVWVDQARIACALERYRLAHGSYPATLDALVPASPHDIFSGHPYSYRLLPDGNFLLYSIGWNQVDDGGKEVNEKDSTHRDYTQGDWVWK